MVTIFPFKAYNACWHSSIHSKLTSFFNIFSKGVQFLHILVWTFYSILYDPNSRATIIVMLVEINILEHQSSQDQLIEIYYILHGPIECQTTNKKMHFFKLNEIFNYLHISNKRRTSTCLFRRLNMVQSIKYTFMNVWINTLKASTTTMKIPQVHFSGQKAWEDTKMSPILS